MSNKRVACGPETLTRSCISTRVLAQDSVQQVWRPKQPFTKNEMFQVDQDIVIKETNWSFVDFTNWYQRTEQICVDQWFYIRSLQSQCFFYFKIQGKRRKKFVNKNKPSKIMMIPRLLIISGKFDEKLTITYMHLTLYNLFLLKTPLPNNIFIW